VITVLDKGTFIASNVAPLANSFIITGSGWNESTGRLGAIRHMGAPFTGNITLAGDATISAYGGAGEYSGIISQSGATARSLTIMGGTVTLTGANTYTGATRLISSSNNPVLIITGPNNVIPDLGAVELATGTELRLNQS